jgi:hypothetical protein
MDFTMKLDYIGKGGGKRASQYGGAKNTRSDARFPPGFVGKVLSHSPILADESFWGAVKRRQSQFQKPPAGPL